MEGQEWNHQQQQQPGQMDGQGENHHNSSQQHNHIMTQQQHQYPVYTPPVQQPACQADQGQPSGLNKNHKSFLILIWDLG